MVAGPTIRGTARGDHADGFGGVDGGLVDGGFAGDQEVDDGEDDQDQAAGDLEILEAQAEEVEDGLAENDETDASGGGDDGGAACDAAALRGGIATGDGQEDRQRAGGINDHEEGNEDQQEVVKDGEHGGMIAQKANILDCDT